MSRIIRVGFIFFFLCAKMLSAETIFYEFGPKTDSVIVLTASLDSANQFDSAAVRLQQFAVSLAQKPQQSHIIIAITQNDISSLPERIAVTRFDGTKKLIQTLSAYSNPAVCILSPGSETEARIIAGSDHSTAPHWLLQSVYRSLKQAEIPVMYDPTHLLFHRLGWLENDPALKLYKQAGIPAIKVVSDMDLSRFFTVFPAILEELKTSEWDTHYLVYQSKNRPILISERLIISILLGAFALILFWTIVLSFFSGSQRDRHIHDLKTLWWMPFVFYAINIIGLLLGRKITEFVFLARFLRAEEMHSFPFEALALKYFFALFCIFLFTSFNTFIPLPRNRVVYGFMANVSCAINLIIFSFIELSFSLFFLAVYLISLVAYQFKNTISQLVFLILMFVPLTPFLTHIYGNGTAMLPILFAGDRAVALILVPIDLLLIRLFLTIEKNRRIRPFKLRIPLQCAVMGTIFVAVLVWTAVMPKPEEYPLKEEKDFIFVHKLDNGAETLVQQYHSVHKPDKAIPYYHQKAASKDGAVQTGDYITAEAAVSNYFGRSIGTLSVHSPLNAEVLHVTIHAADGAQLYEADEAFEKNAAGDTLSFISLPNPTLPFRVRFSAEKDITLTITIRLWSKENQSGISLDENGLQPFPFLLEVCKTLTVQAVPTERHAAGL